MTPVLVWSVAVACAGFFVLPRPVWRLVTRYLVTAAHEAGHALVASVLTASTPKIRLRADTSGVTRFPACSGLRMFLICIAGYPAPGFLGLLGVMAVATGHPRWWLWGLVGLAAVEAFAMVRNVFGWLMTVAWAAGLWAVLTHAGHALPQYVGAAVAAGLLAGGFRTVVELTKSDDDPASDLSKAEELADLPRPVMLVGLWALLVAEMSAAVYLILEPGFVPQLVTSIEHGVRGAGL
jgi:hypothetical protein